MKLRQKFRLYNFISLAAPIAIIGVVSVLFLIFFISKFPVEELYIQRAQLMNPVILSDALNAFFHSNPLAMVYLVIYVLIDITIFVISNTIISSKLATALETPLMELRRYADKIRCGNLNFEIMGFELDEVDDLCEGIDQMRCSLILSKETERRLRREKNLLTANIAHDLKTPITSIKGYIDGINDGIADTPEKLEAYLNTIKAKAEVIDKLVSDLSIYSQLDDSELKLNFSVGDLRDLLLDAADSFRLDFDRCGIELSMRLTDEPLIVNIDGDKMRRVFNNIIENAIKYRAPSDCRISISASADEGFACVSIADNGMGIKPEELTRVFDSFYRSDSSRTSKIKGSGLGLGIAKMICRRHKGRMWLKSDGIGKGTEAVVCIPLMK